MNRREALAAGLAFFPMAAASTVLAPQRACAQGRYPDRPIRLIVPFAPGGATDVVGRLWAEKIRPNLGTVIIENKASGGGALGASEAARAPPGGHTHPFRHTKTPGMLALFL